MSEKSTNIKPLSKFVLAQIESGPTTTPSGLYLPEPDEDKSKIATVVALGPEVKSIKVKDKIIYEEYSGTKLKYMENEYILVPEEKVLAVVV